MFAFEVQQVLIRFIAIENVGKKQKMGGGTAVFIVVSREIDDNVRESN